MFSSLRRLIGLIKVEEVGNMIHIDGIPADVITRDIARYWNTDKINQFMFSQVEQNKLVFNRFFAPEVEYMLTTLINDKSGHKNIRALRKMHDQMLENTWLASTQQEHKDILNYSKFHELKAKPLDHQMRFFQAYNELVPKYQLKGFLLGAAAGSGKSLSCVFLGLALDVDVTIIVCPKNAIFKVWVDTLINDKLGFHKIPKYWTSLDGVPPKKGCKFYITHFDGMSNMLEFVRHNSFRKPMVVLDESHNMNEMDSGRTKVFIDICDTTRSENVVWSSGTLIKALSKETSPMFRTIDRFFDHDAQERITRIYSKNVNKATAILRHRMGLVSFQVNKDEIMGDTPKPISRDKWIKLQDGDKYTLDNIKIIMKDFITDQLTHYRNEMGQYVKRYNYILSIFEKTMREEGALWTQHTKEGMEDEYEEFLKYKKTANLIRESYDPEGMKEEAKFCNDYERKVIIPALPTKALRDEFRNIRSIYKYYPLKVQGEALGRVLGQLRIQCNVELIQHANLHEQIDVVSKKTIIFTSFTEVVDAGFKSLSEQGYEPLRVYGDTNSQIVSIVNKFRDDPNANPLIATYASLSAAVPLVMANQTIFANAPFRDYMYQQAISRMYRLGQDSQTYAWHLYLDTDDKPNISTRSGDILAWSKQQVDAILSQDKQQNGIATESYKTIAFECEQDLIDFVEGVEEEQSGPAWLKW